MRLTGSVISWICEQAEYAARLGIVLDINAQESNDGSENITVAIGYNGQALYCGPAENAYRYILAMVTGIKLSHDRLYTIPHFLESRKQQKDKEDRGNFTGFTWW